MGAAQWRNLLLKLTSFKTATNQCGKNRKDRPSRSGRSLCSSDEPQGCESSQAQRVASKDNKDLLHYFPTGSFKKSPTPSADRVNRDE